MDLGFSTKRRSIARALEALEAVLYVYILEMARKQYGLRGIV